MTHTNALANETSPYLLQHAHNPVDWHPWTPQAFARARAEDKVVFLSIGYSACHWCHVMEHESFENEALAQILNDHFISIKVDREERPDLDEVYMAAVQLITQRGGWPMSVFLTPEGKPFFGGTYFPPESFAALLRRIQEFWRTQREKIREDAEQLAAAVGAQLDVRVTGQGGALDQGLLVNAVEQLAEAFDETCGGFGQAPKFPPHQALPLLLDLETTPALAAYRDQIQTMLRRTLDHLAWGGIHDHLGGGFHRYATDREWKVPHFEKMLYDNALLAAGFAQASVRYARVDYAEVARGTYNWVLREMTSPQGAFFSSFDADSGGEEGKFYVWKKEEIDHLLGDAGAAFEHIFNVQAEGNFAGESTGAQNGLNILYQTGPLGGTGPGAPPATLQLSADAWGATVEQWRAMLYAVRANRVHPACDDKILTGWNALMISALARGATWLNEKRYAAAAVRAAQFLLAQHRGSSGRWLASSRQGQAKLPAYLSDHAYLAAAFVDLYEATGERQWKNEALQVVEAMERHFAGASGPPASRAGPLGSAGAYFFTADDHEVLLTRFKDPLDKVTPSGNGIAAQTLLRLAAEGEDRLRERALAILREFQPLMSAAPRATESLLLACAWHLTGRGCHWLRPFAASAKTEPAPIQAGSTAGQEVQNQGRNRQRLPAALTSDTPFGAVRFELHLAQTRLAPGQRVKLEVRAQVSAPWHLAAEGLRISIPLQSRPVGTLEDIVLPEGRDFQAGGDTWRVYSGSFVISAVLNVAPDLPAGRQRLDVKITFQACDDQACQKPESTVVSVWVER